MLWKGNILLCLLAPVFCAAGKADEFDMRFAKDLTRHLYLRHKLESFLIFSANRKLLPTLPYLRNSLTLERFLVENMNRPLILWGLQNNVSLAGLLTRRAMSVATIRSLSPEDEPIFKAVQGTLNGRHDMRILFILKTVRKPSAEEIHKFFVWCWATYLINVALTYQEMTNNNGSYSVYDELITYSPFPEVRVHNVTDMGAKYNWELTDINNVRGYVFRIPVFQDIAGAAYLLPNGNISGSMGLLVTSFIQHINGRIRIERTSHVNRYNYHNHTLMWANQRIIDIGVHPYTYMNIGAEKLEGLITLTYTKTCLMVPLKRELPLQKFIRYSIRVNGLYLIFLLSVFILGWLLVARDSRTGFLYAVTIFNMQPINGTMFNSFSNPHRLVYMAFLLSTFLLWNVRTGYLSSAFSHKLSLSKIHNLQDFLESPMPIMATETEIEMYFTRELLPKELLPYVYVVNASTLMEHLKQLNTSYAYFSTASMWRLTKIRQSRLRNPLFRRLKPGICTSGHIRMIPMHRNSPFREKFLDFYITTRITGSLLKWEQLSQLQAMQAGLLNTLRETEVPFVSLDLKHFAIVIKSYLLCVGVCILCLLCEIAWKHQANKRTR